MLKYYNFVSEEKLPTLSAKLSWSHYDEILKYDDVNKIAYYIKICERQNLSIRQLSRLTGVSFSVIRNYLEWLLNLPWNKYSKDEFNLNNL